MSDLLRPRDVARQLDISGAGLRRLSTIYERHYGLLEREESGARLWTERAVARLERARALYNEGHAESIEAAFALVEQEGPRDVTQIAEAPSADPIAVMTEMLVDIRSVLETLQTSTSELKSELSELKQGQGKRVEELERRNRALLDELERRESEEPKRGLGGWFRERG